MRSEQVETEFNVVLQQNALVLELLFEHQARTNGFITVPATAMAHQIAASVIIRPHEVAAFAQKLRVRSASAIAALFKWLHRSRVWRYEKDDRRDQWQTPRRTLRRRRGDCEDWSALAVSLLRAAGMTAHLVLGYLNTPRWGHAYCVGQDRFGFFLFEATNGQIHRSWPRGYYATLVAE